MLLRLQRGNRAHMIRATSLKTRVPSGGESPPEPPLQPALAGWYEPTTEQGPQETSWQSRLALLPATQANARRNAAKTDETQNKPPKKKKFSLNKKAGKMPPLKTLTCRIYPKTKDKEVRRAWLRKAWLMFRAVHTTWNAAVAWLRKEDERFPCVMSPIRQVSRIRQGVP